MSIHSVLNAVKVRPLIFKLTLQKGHSQTMLNHGLMSLHVCR